MKIDLLSMFVMVLCVLSVSFSGVEGEEKYNNQKLTAEAARLVRPQPQPEFKPRTTKLAHQHSSIRATTTTSPTQRGIKDSDLVCDDKLDNVFESVTASNITLSIQCCNEGTPKTCVGAECSTACGNITITCIKFVNFLGDSEHCNSDTSDTHIEVVINGAYCQHADCPKTYYDPHLYCCKHSSYNGPDKCQKECKCKGTCHYAKEHAKSMKQCFSYNSACCECRAYSEMSKNKCETNKCPNTIANSNLDTDCSKVAKNCTLCGEKKYWKECEKECNCNCTCKSFLNDTGCPSEFSACCDCGGQTNYTIKCPHTCGFKEGECIEDNPFRVFLHYFLFNKKNTPEFCIEKCREAGYAFAGVEDGNECFCGNCYVSRKIVVPSDDCEQSRCPGNRTLFCGGFMRMKVYATGLKVWC